MMFVPANLRRRWERAHLRGADALIVDLEDGVGPADKVDAREMLSEAVAFLTGQGAVVLVRINASWLLAMQDLAAAIIPGVRGVLIPKMEDPGRLLALSQIVGELEAQRKLPAGAAVLVPMIESPLGIERLSEIAAVERVGGLALGVEDFSLSLGVEPTPECLDLPCRLIAFAANARGLAGFGVPMSIIAIDQPEAYGEAARRARAMGLTGALCADPRQVEKVNVAFSPSAAEIAAARALLAAWEAGGGTGMVKFEGRIIDAPVARRAERVLAQARS
jgi:citrate lyase subunit beta/citryl-CoA lyase